MFTYTPFSLSATKSLCTSFIFWCMGLAILIPFSLAYSIDLPVDEEIDTLDVIWIRHRGGSIRLRAHLYVRRRFQHGERRPDPIRRFHRRRIKRQSNF